MKLEARQPIAEMRGRGITGAVRSCAARDHSSGRGVGRSRMCLRGLEQLGLKGGSDTEVGLPARGKVAT